MNESGRRPVVPGYEVGPLLGAGSSAQVWQATPADGGAPVALKVLTLADGAAMTAVHGEAALLTALDHPHLLRVQALVAVTSGEPRRPEVALVLDLAAGGSLAGLLLRRSRLTPGEVVTALAPVATALAYVHDQALVHGDVTPANVLFTAAGEPVLADLGVARVLGGYGPVRTTAAYADPAVAAGGCPTPASDVFMLAATAVHALTGAPPWTDPLPAAALARAATGEIDAVLASLGALPVAVVAVLREALRPEPHLRPSAAAFALDLRRAATPRPVELAAGRRVAGRPAFDRPRWAGDAVSTGQRETHAVRAALAELPPAAQQRWHRRRRPVAELDPIRAAQLDPVRAAKLDPVRPAEPSSGPVGGACAVDAPLLPMGRRRPGVQPPKPIAAARPSWEPPEGRPTPGAAPARPAPERDGRPVRDGAPVSGGLGPRHARPAPPPRPVRRPPLRPLQRDRRPIRVRWLVPAVVLLLAVGTAGTVWSLGGGSSRGARADVAATAAGTNAAGTNATGTTAAGTNAAGPTTEGWARVLDQLDARRAQAFAEHDPTLLRQVYTPGVLLDQDVAELALTVPDGCVLVGVRTSYDQVTEAGRGEATVALTARASLAPSSLRCPGRPPTPVAGIAATAVQVTLSRLGGTDYRISGQQVG